MTTLNASFIRSQINRIEPEMCYYTNIDNYLLNTMRGQKESTLSKMMSIKTPELWKQEKRIHSRRAHNTGLSTDEQLVSVQVTSAYFQWNDCERAKK